MQNMEYKWIVPFTLLAFILALVNCDKPSFDGKNLLYGFRRHMFGIPVLAATQRKVDVVY